jgi:erythrin-vacuolar iron transport family protein
MTKVSGASAVAVEPPNPALTPAALRRHSSCMLTLDFSRLSLQDALDLAILIEEEAQERYEEFTANLEVHHTPEAAGFFSTMAGNEAKHGADLLARRKSLFGDAPTRVSRDMLWDVEAPDFDQPRMFMTPRQAMDVALACEVKAYDYFDAALTHVQDADVRTLFEELRGEEAEHQALVKAMMAKLPEGTVVDAGFEPDDPVGQ